MAKALTPFIKPMSSPQTEPIRRPPASSPVDKAGASVDGGGKLAETQPLQPAAERADMKKTSDPHPATPPAKSATPGGVVWTEADGVMYATPSRADRG